MGVREVWHLSRDHTASGEAERSIQAAMGSFTHKMGHGLSAGLSLIKRSVNLMLTGAGHSAGWCLQQGTAPFDLPPGCLPTLTPGLLQKCRGQSGLTKPLLCCDALIFFFSLFSSASLKKKVIPGCRPQLRCYDSGMGHNLKPEQLLGLGAPLCSP